MRHAIRTALVCCLLCPLALSRVSAEPGEALPGVAERTAGLAARHGLLTVYPDPAHGRLWLEVPPTADPRGEIGRYLYVEGLVTGLGANPVGLDRGQLGPSAIVALRRVGGRLLIERINSGFRALSPSVAERRAVEESFATSVIWAGPFAALDGDGRALVDLTPFVARDSHGVVGRLKDSGQGSYEVDSQRSAIDLDSCLVFPRNVEFEALVTYVGGPGGEDVRQVAPDPESLSFVQHQSLVQLPDPGYRPRAFDPRAGSFAVSFADYAAPLDRPLVRRWIVRHRLEKTDPNAARSPVKEPIVYSVDRGVPEPVRSALIEGAGWWAKAFDAAGFIDAFHVELLPEGANPLDARYNVIQWVHRATRGWSYGGGVIDPRTGEMVKGHVSLGSLRIRQDRLLFEGLVGVDRTGRGGPDDPVELALARIRQLAAHEVGHTLGFNHNFAASSYGRASVLDYPAPLVVPGGDGRLDLSHAYEVGVGTWDLHAVRYAYAQFPEGADEAAELEAIVREGLERGLLFLTDADARPPGAAQPLASLWDNGGDPVEELARVLRVREIALQRFGRDNVAVGQPLARLEEVLATVYFYHRYQLAAAVKVVGGLDYRYALRGDGQPPARPVGGALQRTALRGTLDALDPRRLDLPDDLLALLLPPPADEQPNREMFARSTGPAFDALGAAATAADLVVRGLLNPERCARLVDFHRRDAALPGLDEVLDALVDRAFEAPGERPSRLAEVAGAVQHTVVAGLIRLAEDPTAAPWVAERADSALDRLSRRIEADGETLPAARAAALTREIDDHRRRPRESRPAVEPAAPAPPGSPIGSPPPLSGGAARPRGVR